MKLRLLVSSMLLIITIALSAQSPDECIARLEIHNISLDSTDKNWLKENSSFLVDMSSLAKVDTTAMNRAIIQMSTKLLSNNLTDITDEEARSQRKLIVDIIHGAFDHHGLPEEKKLSAMSWYNMIVKEIKI